jgi:transposase-like protein
VSELLKLQICPKCKDTRHVYQLPYAILNPPFVCQNCNVEWSQRFIRDLGTNEIKIFPWELS